MLQQMDEQLKEQETHPPIKKRFFLTLSRNLTLLSQKGTNFFFLQFFQFITMKRSVRSLNELKDLYSFELNGYERRFAGWSSSKFSYHNTIQLRKLPAIGYDFYTNQPLPPQTLLLSIPKDVWYPFSAAHSRQMIEQENESLASSLQNIAKRRFPSPASTKSFLESSSLALKLMNDLMGSSSHPYPSFLEQTSFPVLSDEEALPHPLLMDPSRYLTPYLSGTVLYDNIMIRQRLYQEIANDLFPTSEELQRLFIWSIGIILSRAISGQNLPFSCVPILDFTNHADIEHENALKTYNASKECYELWSTKKIAANESIRINYGRARDNNSFMTLYGFIGNESDSVVRSVETFSLRLSSSSTRENFRFLKNRSSRESQMLANCVLQITKSTFPDFKFSIQSNHLLVTHQILVTSVEEIKSKKPAAEIQLLEKLGSLLELLDACEDIIANPLNFSEIASSTTEDMMRVLLKKLELHPRKSPTSIKLALQQLLYQHLKSILSEEKVKFFQNHCKMTTNPSNDYLNFVNQLTDSVSSAAIDSTQKAWRRSCIKVIETEVLSVLSLLQVLNLK